MIIETMTKSEIISDIQKDEDLLYARLRQNYGFKLRRRLIKTRTKSITIWSKERCHFNTYIAILEATKKEMTIMIINHHQTKIGLRCVAPLEIEGWSFYNGHFFRRYNERMNLNISSPLEVASSYFLINRGFTHSYVEKVDNRLYAVASVNEGIALGYEENEIFTWNTFVPRNMLTKSQKIIDIVNMIDTGIVDEDEVFSV